MTRRSQFQTRTEVLNIHTDTEGTFIERPNRFLAIVEIDNNGTKTQEKVHVHDPGRLLDILYPGNRVLLRKASNPNRKTGWDMIAGISGDNWILINSAFHRQISEWVLENGIIEELSDNDSILPEQKYGDSRLDYLLLKDGQSTWIEVKGCTLAEGSVASFPDAPTTRGKRHLEELIKARSEGHDAAAIILVLRPEAECFTANGIIDPAFARTFEEALKAGVKVFPLQFSFEDGNIRYLSQLPLCDKVLY
ncbi:DNA/RNA nuclease SfsA [Methanolobus profundi]|uniref:Sugar fermentation stimulation protein homolog n=1 Tax=Methanolobus profundi TaxID=487685 RepID=A0A1I4PKG9_9EURY|nr:DNA/RNA nuclease SfsA [Methanolobus profundi]SFM27953.1 sugar fermentation stimulation protein A [Methanolobus profundi]